MRTLCKILVVLGALLALIPLIIFFLFMWPIVAVCELGNSIFNYADGKPWRFKWL